MSDVGVFISYSHKDKKIAEAVVDALFSVSQDIKVFIDHSGLEGGDEYEPKLSESIRKSQWFVMISSGLGKVEKDMSWCFYEAGQFRAKLESAQQLNAIRDRLCYLFDNDRPSQLSRYQGTRVSKMDKNKNILNIRDENDDSLNYENTELFDFLGILLTKSTDVALSDIGQPSVRKLMRTAVRRITLAFVDNTVVYPLPEEVFQPRIKFTLPPVNSIGEAEGLKPATEIAGEYNVLPVIFGIGGTTTTWEALQTSASTMNDYGMRPLWINDLEEAAKVVAKGKVPKQTDLVCLGSDKIFYRPIFARTVPFSDGTRDIYVAFIPSRDRRFNLSFRTSMLLSALILTVRFRQKVLPLVGDIAKNAKASETKKAELLRKLQTSIVLIEAEAQEFGLRGPRDEHDEPPLLNAFRDGPEKEAMRADIVNWVGMRATIFEKIAAAQGPNREATWADAADAATAALLNMRAVNSTFIEKLCSEILYATSVEP